MAGGQKSPKLGRARRKLVYILSPSFSGSTLLTMLLAQHPRIATIGELKATAMGPTEDYPCSCGELITECRFWQELESECAAGGMGFDVAGFGTHFTSEGWLCDRVMGAQVRGVAFEGVRRLLLKVPGVTAEYDRILDRNRQLIELICDLQGADFFLDGSKDPQRLLYFHRSGHWDVKILRMHRDGRAQSNSRRKKTRNPIDFLGAVREWKNTIRQMDRVCAGIPSDRIHTLRYEDLCDHPGGIMAAIWEFLQIDPVAQDWEGIDLRKREHHILGNSMRTKERIEIRLDSGWEEVVSPAELQCFEREAGDVNRKLGYANAPRRVVAGA